MVVVYLTTAIGIPVYMHYCGGELEKVSYLIKSDGCCSEDEDGDMGGCCQNENTFAQCAPDFTVKKVIDSNFNIADFDLFTVAPLLFDLKIENISFVVSKYFIPPPDSLHQDIIQSTFLRI
jgi:hypothetical protein